MNEQLPFSQEILYLLT